MKASGIAVGGGWIGGVLDVQRGAGAGANFGGQELHGGCMRREAWRRSTLPSWRYAKSQDKNIREFATKMIHDHEMLIQQMKPLAVKYHVKPATGPSAKDRAIYEDLKAKSGTDFDKRLCGSHGQGP